MESGEEIEKRSAGRLACFLTSVTCGLSEINGVGGWDTGTSGGREVRRRWFVGYTCCWKAMVCRYSVAALVMRLGIGFGGEKGVVTVFGWFTLFPGLLSGCGPSECMKMLETAMMDGGISWGKKVWLRRSL